MYFVLNEEMAGSVCVMVCGSVCGATVEVITFVGVSCLHPGACACMWVMGHTHECTNIGCTPLNSAVRAQSFGDLSGPQRTPGKGESLPLLL